MNLTKAENLIKEFFRINQASDLATIDNHAGLLLKYNNNVALRYKAAANYWLRNS